MNVRSEQSEVLRNLRMSRRGGLGLQPTPEPSGQDNADVPADPAPRGKQRGKAVQVDRIKIPGLLPMFAALEAAM